MPKGYNLQTVTPTPANLVCPLCHLIFKETIQTERGERCCKECYSEATKLYVDWFVWFECVLCIRKSLKFFTLCNFSHILLTNLKK